MSIVKSKRKKAILVLAITLFWLATGAELVRRELFLPSLPSGSIGIAGTLPAESPSKDQWMGIYFEDEKIGYSSTTVSRLSSTKDPGYIIMNRIFMVVMLLDNAVKVHFDALLRTDENFRMRNFKSTLRSAGHEIQLDGKLENDMLSLSILSGNKVFRKEVKVSEGINLSNTLTPLLYLPNLEPGVTYSVDILDPMSFATNKAKLTITGMEPFEYEQKSIDVYVVETIYQGVTYTAWVTEGGEVLKEKTPMGWTLLREDRSVASEFRADAATFRRDISKLVAVPSDIRIAKPEQTSGMEVHITGIDTTIFMLDGAGQHLIDAATGLTRITAHRRESDINLTIPITEESLAEYLKPTLFIQSDDENIRSLASRIVADERDSFVAAGLINQWVFDNINKKITFSLPSAVEVLETREGDCNEHTTLFVALARAIGIPAKIAIGLVYHEGCFYYHAWPEVFVGEWIAMDPTLGQLRADATHIRLLEGDLDQQAKLMQAIGKIEISVKSLSYDAPKQKEAVL